MLWVAVLVEDLNLFKTRTIAQEATGFYGEDTTLAERLSGIRTQIGHV